MKKLKNTKQKNKKTFFYAKSLMIVHY